MVYVGKEGEGWRGWGRRTRCACDAFVVAAIGRQFKCGVVDGHAVLVSMITKEYQVRARPDDS